MKTGVSFLLGINKIQKKLGTLTPYLMSVLSLWDEYEEIPRASEGGSAGEDTCC